MESLLTLVVTSFILLAVSGSVTNLFTTIQETLFFREFEQLYRDSQQLAATSHQTVQLTIAHDTISNGYQEVAIPTSVAPQADYQIAFDKKGGNSSLAKLSFDTHHKTVHYQLYLGSGRYKTYTD